MFSLCVYCGSRSGDDPRYAEAARALGTALGRAGHRLVYGGGHAGLMGTVADATLAAGGQVLGIIPRRLVARELGHRGIQELRVVDTMHERKLQMAQAADAFVALPGGIGTLEELVEQLTWAQLYRDNGLKWEKIVSVKPPQGIDAIYSLRITQSRRCTAYRDGEFMRLLTVAPDHDSTYGKK